MNRNRRDWIVLFAYPNELSSDTGTGVLKKASGVNHHNFLDDLMFNPLCSFRLTSLTLFYPVTTGRTKNKKNKKTIMVMLHYKLDVELW